MNSNKTVTANFVKKKYALTTTVEGEGTVTEKVIKAGAATDYNSGTVVELTATSKWRMVVCRMERRCNRVRKPKRDYDRQSKDSNCCF